MLDANHRQLGEHPRSETRPKNGQRHTRNCIPVERHDLPNAFDVHLIGVTDDYGNATLLRTLEPMGLDHLHQPARDPVEHFVDQLNPMNVALCKALHQHRFPEPVNVNETPGFRI